MFHMNNRHSHKKCRNHRCHSDRHVRRPYIMNLTYSYLDELSMNCLICEDRQSIGVYKNDFIFGFCINDSIKKWFIFVDTCSQEKRGQLPAPSHNKHPYEGRSFFNSIIFGEDHLLFSSYPSSQTPEPWSIWEWWWSPIAQANQWPTQIE